MEIKGKVYCFFEQSGTFKNEFKKLGYEAYDFDIQNNFNETDRVIDLFREIDTAYNGGGYTVFDEITEDDLIVAFYPCIYFSAVSQMNLSMTAKNNRNLKSDALFHTILKRIENREEFYKRLVRFCAVCIERGIRMIFENPWSEQTYLKANFIKTPDVVDMNRMDRGDFFKKPTAYWFFNCEPTHGFSHQNDKMQKTILSIAPNGQVGVCNEERSMISSDYARNWICDFVIGKDQHLEPTLFDFDEDAC